MPQVVSCIKEAESSCSNGDGVKFLFGKAVAEASRLGVVGADAIAGGRWRISGSGWDREAAG